MLSFRDSAVMPITGETPTQRWEGAIPLANTDGAAYVAKRAIPITIAEAAGVRFDANWNGRSAVVVPMKDCSGNICLLHGRYLTQFGKQNKMFTIGTPGGVIWVHGTVSCDTIILVEGLFDALSVGLCGYAAIATVGRWANWLPEYCDGKKVLLGFDAARSGDATALFYTKMLQSATLKRLLPPDHCKDWNTALVKRGQHSVTRCLQQAVSL